MMNKDQSAVGERRAKLSSKKRAMLEARLRGRDRSTTAEPDRIPPRPALERYPLSYAQQRLWFLHQLEPENPYYNEYIAVRLRGKLNIPILERSVSQLVARHESLRTIFPVFDGKPTQVIQAPSDVFIPVVDLEEESAGSSNMDALQATATAATRAPFDLATGPLFRLALYRLQADDYVFIISFHHIMADGWSLASVMVRECIELYEMLVMGMPVQLTPLVLQYADFAYWQRELLDENVLKGHLDYWTSQLADLPVLQLPSDQLRRNARTFQGAKHLLMLPPDVSQNIHTFGQEERVTLFMTLLASFKALLYRYAGQNDIVVGAPIANRNRAELNNIIGFFVNTIVLRTKIPSAATFRQLVHGVKQTLLQAHQHQELPFDRIVDALHPTRNIDQNPLFQVMFLFHDVLSSAVSPSGLQVSHVEFDHGIAKFDLTLFMRDDGTQLSGLFEYDVDIFQQETIVRMANHLEHLLAEVMANPDIRLDDIVLLDEKEEAQIVYGWNKTNHGDSHFFVHETIAAQAKSTPNAIAVADTASASTTDEQPENQECVERNLTYQQLDAYANQLAHFLRANGVGPESIIAICVEPGVEMLVGLLGILKAGGAYLPMQPTDPAARLDYILRDSNASLVLTQSHLLDSLPTTPSPTFCLDRDWSQVAEESASAPTVDLCADDLAYVIYTSGSTGQPKGTLITHGGLSNYLSWCKEAYPLSEGHGATIHSSIAFDMAVTSLYAPLLVGATVYMAPSHVATAEKLAHLLTHTQDKNPKKMSLIKLTPAQLTLLSQQINADEAANLAHAFIIGGENLTYDQLAFWREFAPHTQLINEYGPTETVVGCCVHTVPAGTAASTGATALTGETALSNEEPSGSVPIGRPIRNTQLYVLDQQWRPVPIGVVGELYIGGDGIARGYLHQPARTAAAFLPDPFSKQPGRRLYKTGDLARYRSDGVIEFLGRLDDQVKVRGYRVELGEISTVLAQHPALQDVVLALIEKEGDDQKQLVAYVVPDEKPDGAYQQAHQAQQVRQWQTLYENLYAEPPSPQDQGLDTTIAEPTTADPLSNLAGWTSSYTGEPLPAAEMHDWIDNTVAQILALNPQRVLEIGCGTGLLLLRVAPHCQRYWGADFAQSALDYVAQQLPQIEAPADLRLIQSTADQIGRLRGEKFDTVVLNSVVQYFPDYAYLQQVITEAVALVEPGGHIFIGDVRSLPLLRAFYTSIQLETAPDDRAAEDALAQIERQIFADEELILDPQFFLALPSYIPQISAVDIQLKRGAYQNELTRFRYDVTLHVQRSTVALDFTALHWLEDKLSIDRLEEILCSDEPAVLTVSHIPNARVAMDVAATVQLQGGAIDTMQALRADVAAVNQTSVDPEWLFALSERVPYRLIVEPMSIAAAPEYVRATFYHHQQPLDPAQKILPAAQQSFATGTLSQWANNPLAKQSLAQDVLRSFVARRLPDYMIPSLFVQLPEIPLTANGKVNRRALPPPGVARPELAGAYVEPESELEKMLAQIWSEFLGVERVGRHDNFFDLGGHSLLATQIYFRLRTLSIPALTMRTMLQYPTIAGLAHAMSQGDLRNGTLSEAELDLVAEAVLAPEITPDGCATDQVNVLDAVLLTGGTGFLGAFLLHELLQQTSATIYCLVRAADSEQGQQRLLGALSFYGLPTDGVDERIVPVLGDLALPQLGIGHDVYASLAETVGAIYHNGAFVNFVYEYDQLKAANVKGTEEVLRLACTKRLKAVHFVSTISVFPGGDRTTRFSEDDRLSPEGIVGGYAQSKWVAERLVQLAQERGVPTTIHRPASITGDSRTGAWNTDDFFCRLIKGCVELGSMPDADVTLNLTPVDYVSKAIIYLSQQPAALNHAFHFINSHYVSSLAVGRAIQDCGYPLAVERYNLWRSKLGQVTESNPLFPLLTFFPEAIPDDVNLRRDLPIYDETNVKNYMDQADIGYPVADAKLVATYIRYFVRTGYLPDPLAERQVQKNGVNNG